MLIIEDRDILSFFDKEIIKDKIINNSYFPFYWNDYQTPNDNLPFLFHSLKSREIENPANNILYDFFKEILLKFCKKHNLKLNKIHRACINLTFPVGKDIGTIHKDHEFEHKQLLIYLNNSDEGSTYIYDDNKNLIKEIIYEQFKAVCFDNCFHAGGFPKSKRRLVCVITFN